MSEIVGTVNAIESSQDFRPISNTYDSSKGDILELRKDNSNLTTAIRGLKQSIQLRESENAMLKMKVNELEN